MTIDFATILGLIAGTSGVGGILVAISTRKKTKADALSIIDQAAANQVLRMQQEAERWHRECQDLRSEVDTLKGRLDEQDACQTTLRVQLSALEREKADLLNKLEQLKRRVEDLEAENQRLKRIADKVDA